LDRPEALARCLDALFSGHKLPAELVVVDQSNGQSAQTVVERHRLKRTLIHYIHQQRRGLSISRNTALHHAHCPIVAVTDDDCVPDPNWVAALERTFASSATLVAVTGRVLPLGPEVPGLYMIAARESSVRADFRAKTLPWVVGSGNNY